MRRKVSGQLVPVVILTALQACDNVEWGGVDAELEPPSTPSRWHREAGAPLPGAEGAPLELGPLLYVVERGPEGFHALPVARLDGAGYGALPGGREAPDLEERFVPEVLAPGSELVLFEQGRRVGTFLVQGAAEPDEAYCRARPRVAGQVELREGVEGSGALLGLAKADHPPFSHEGGPPLAEGAEDRSGSVTVATRLLEDAGAALPSSIPDARRDLRVFPLGLDGGRAFAASFVVGDELEVGEPSEPAYALFFVAAPIPEEERVEPIWYWYQRNDEGGKAWPRFVAPLDWRRSGTEDLLLRVYGSRSTWFAVVGLRNTEWELIFQEPCAQLERVDRTGPGV